MPCGYSEVGGLHAPKMSSTNCRGAGCTCVNILQNGTEPLPQSVIWNSSEKVHMQCLGTEEIFRCRHHCSQYSVLLVEQGSIYNLNLSREF